MSEEDYQLLVNLYLSRKTLDKADIEQFNGILARTTVNEVGLIRLIGDEFADRGKNDFLILKILEKLGTSGVKFEILFSNHGAEFHARVINSTYVVLPLDWPQAPSLPAMLNLIPDIVAWSDMAKLINTYYLPNLKALSYSIDNTGSTPILTLYTHAAVGLETLKELAKFYKVEYQDNSLSALCNTIDKINEAFGASNPSEILKKEIQKTNGQFTKSLHFPTRYPMARLTWHRGNGRYQIELPSFQNGYYLRSVHGHEGPLQRVSSTASYAENIVNLDGTNLGKADGIVDVYFSLFSLDKPSLEKSATAEEKKPEEVKPTRAVATTIPTVYWDRKDHPVIQAKIKDSIKSLQTIVGKRETERKNSFFGSFFKDDRLDASKKMISLLERKEVTKFTEDELKSLRKDELALILTKMEKDVIMPGQFIDEEFHMKRRGY